MARSGSSLRVEGGEAGGRRLAAPAGIRPTQGLVKGAIFNMLGDRLHDAVVLDLFAGSGGLGLEALSRGASSAVLVDRSHDSVEAIRRNLEALGYGNRARAVRAEVPSWLADHPEEVAAATIVLVDPPYNDPVLDRALAILDRLCGPGAIVVVEHSRRHPLPALDRLRARPARRHGDTAISLLDAS